jgi:hypothetical protein
MLFVKRASAKGILCCLIAASLALSACEPSPHPQAQDGSLEYKLAVINAGGIVSQDDPSIGQFRSLLGSIASKCPSSPEDIADVAVAAQKIMKEKGLADSLLEVMEALDRSIPPGNGIDIKEVASAYVVLRTGGR